MEFEKINHQRKAKLKSKFKLHAQILHETWDNTTCIDLEKSIHVVYMPADDPLLVPTENLFWMLSWSTTPLLRLAGRVYGVGKRAPNPLSCQIFWKKSMQTLQGSLTLILRVFSVFLLRVWKMQLDWPIHQRTAFPDFLWLIFPVLGHPLVGTSVNSAGTCQYFAFP